MIKTLLIYLLVITSLSGFCQDSIKSIEPIEYLKYTFLDSNGNKIYDNIDNFSEAQFPGGEKEMNKYLTNYIKENLVISEDDLNTIYFNVEFKVSELGTLTDIETYIENDPYYDSQLIEAFRKMPNWIPATISGKPVTQVIKHSFGIPIKHKIE